MPVELRWVFTPFPLHGHADKIKGWHMCVLTMSSQAEEHLLLKDSILVCTGGGAIEPVSFSLSI